MSNDQLKGIARDLAWLACLEDAGVDNWSGIEFAGDLMRENFPEEEE